MEKYFNSNFQIIVKIQPNDGNNKALALPRFICKSEASYLIIEGLSYFGLELVDFLVSRGAKNIVIVSEAKNTGLYSNPINMWKQYGVSVVVHEKVDLSHRQRFITLFKQIHSLGTIDAIFDLQRIENLSTRSESSKYIITKYVFEYVLNMFLKNLNKSVPIYDNLLFLRLVKILEKILKTFC